MICDLVHVEHRCSAQTKHKEDCVCIWIRIWNMVVRGVLLQKG